jgi:hypothetical protein
MNAGQIARVPSANDEISFGTPVAPARAMKILSRALLWLLTLMTVREHQAWAGWSLALAGRVERVVSTDDHVAAVRGKTVILLREDGSSMGQLAEPASESRRKTSRPDGREREDILDFLGIDEGEQDSAWVEDELNNESTLMQRRLRREGRRERNAPAGGSPAIAAGAHDIWIANSRGLWTWPDAGSLLHVSHQSLSGARMSASSDGQVLVAADDQVWLFTSNQGSYRLLASGESVRHVAVSPSGRPLVWANGTRIEFHDSADDPGQFVRLPQPIQALQYCDESLLLLSHEGLSLFAFEGTPIPLAPRLAAHRLACADGIGPWLAIGPDLLTSDDRGHTWTSITIPITARVLDAAVGKDCLWVATDRGLFRVSAQSSADDLMVGDFAPSQELAFGPRMAPWWAAWLPQLTVAGGAFLARGRRDIQTVALATFPLDAPTPRRSFRLVADNNEVPIPHETRPVEVTVPPDPDAECLAATRSKAVSLAMVEPERARSYVDRARHAAWLPELRLRVDRRFGRSESLDVPSTSTSVTSPLGVDTVDDVRYEGRVTWDLARLIFSNDELAAQSQSMHMAEMRRDIEVTVSRLYFERRRLRLERLSAGASDRTVRRELRVREIEAELDALSGGAFSQCTAARTTGQGDS